MCAGLPIVTTDMGCIVGTVENGANGFIVGAEDTSALVARILELLGDDDMRERMGSCSRQKYLNYYTLDRWGRDMCEALGSALLRA
jgi:glycosyltransferase involved in cell wall biosynthesis